MDYRKGKGTRDGIFQLRMISERIIDLNAEKVIKGKTDEEEKTVLMLRRLSESF